MSKSEPLSLSQVLLAGGLIVTLSMGVRHGFGQWLQPMTQAYGWTRETFALAIAIQNLTWGAAQPFAGMLADRMGAFKVLLLGGLLYALGLSLMAVSSTGMALGLSAGVLLGLAQACSTYTVVYGVIGRNVAADRRTWAMGVAAAAGSFGQFLMVPVEQYLIFAFNWQQALFILAVLTLAIWPLAFALREKDFQPMALGNQTITQAIGEAFANRNFRLLMAGYFVCGFQVVFIGIHLPSYLKDKSMDPQVATIALALIGLFNVFGTYLAGVLGQRYAKRYSLAVIYLSRSVVISLFLWFPLSPLSVYIFAAAMGFLWLSTVPLTNGIVAQVFGVQYLSMLGGFVFFSHQIGSFMGVWLGGKLFDLTGSYDLVWGLTIALGVFAALINLPIRETALRREPVLT